MVSLFQHLFLMYCGNIMSNINQPQNIPAVNKGTAERRDGSKKKKTYKNKKYETRSKNWSTD